MIATARPTATHTPWGHSTSSKQYAPGITFHATASHGGFHLSEDRHAVVKQTFPTFQTFAGGAWYEEDCDWSVVVLANPGSFDDGTICAAIRTARGMASLASVSASTRSRGWQEVVAWLDTTDAGAAVVGRAARA